MLYDKEFLKKLDNSKTKVIYAKIIALNIDENPIETIEGRVTQGSINLDGSSAVRRTCSLTMIANEYDYSNYLWGLNTKFKLEIGLENNVDFNYPDIIWFKQGTYLISSFNAARSTNNFTITLQGKDKMCALNGEVGGAFTSSVDVGTIEEIDNNKNKRIIHLPMKEIIRNVVQLYGGELAHNIIINDLDMNGLELLEYRYDENHPMYLYREAKEGTDFINITLDGDKPCIVEDDNSVTKLSELNSNHLDLLITPMTGTSKPKKIKIEEVDYYVAKVSFGETAGYRKTDLIYPGDLIANVGESVTSILDKIKTVLGEFEYFYNLDGQFIFQKKKTQVRTAWHLEDTDGNSFINDDNEIAYVFNNGELVTTFNNNPDLSNLKNDFSVWGERASVSGAAIPVHMRYAIDKKPIQYNRIVVDDNNQNLIDYNRKYGTTIKGQNEAFYSVADYDWREILYRMAQDYYKYAHILDNFDQLLVQYNPEFTSGKTGYENYYIDLISFWRDLYDPDTLIEVSLNTGIAKINKFQYQKRIEELENLLKDEELSDTDKIQYQQELTKTKELLNITLKLIEDNNQKIDDYKNNYYYEAKHKYKNWNKTVYEAPQNLNFWFDFLDSEGELSQYSVRNVGCRPKAINDSSVKAIYFRETPEILFIQNNDEKGISSDNYKYIHINSAYVNTMFSISAQGQSAKSKIDELLYAHSYCTESATINTVPIYYLEPNTKIRIIDEETKLNGYYIINKLTIPLTYNGTMSITANKIVEEL